LTLFQNEYRIESTRLKDWDYRARGWYFVTLCTQSRRPVLGSVVAGEMKLSPIGLIANAELITLSSHYRNVQVDEHVLMPNHVHAILMIHGDHCFMPNAKPQLPIHPAFVSLAAGSLSTIFRAYKGGVARKCHELAAVREFIRNNPANWSMDRENHPCREPATISVARETLQATSLRLILSCMKLYRGRERFVVERADQFYEVRASSWDEIVAREDLVAYLEGTTSQEKPLDRPILDFLSPIGSQEVWAAGVTYYRSRDARMEESKDAGGGNFYDRVYSAARPELFFKATPHRVVGSGDKVAIRSDASWSVPEPELVLFITPGGKIAGYTIGNDMSSRDIEGENPLYLPQAKVYDRSCALGPCLLVSEEPLPASTEIAIEIRRDGQSAFSGATTLKEMKRTPADLARYLYHSSSFPYGCFLFTGTGIVPPDSFTLQLGDGIQITIPPIGTLVNVVG